LALAGPSRAGENRLATRGMMGYRGDGSSVARGSNPPTSFDAKTRQNVRWVSPVPQWGYGSPVVAKGKVFVMVETDAEHDFPSLVCYDLATGKQLWRKMIDIPSMLPDSPAIAKGLSAWREFLALDRLMYTMNHRRRRTDDPNAFKKELARHGLEISRKNGPGMIGCVDRRRPFRLARTFNRLDLYFDVWHWSGMAMIGYSFPTPVTDGEHIYVATGSYGFACYDTDGKVLWQRFLPGQGSSQAGYGGNDFCKQARSPLLHGDLLISDVGNLVRAINRKTGKIEWSHEKYRGHAPIVSPVVATVGGTDVLLTFGPHAFRLPDGKELKIEGWGNQGATAMVKYDEPDVVFYTGGGEHGGWRNKGKVQKGKCKYAPPAAVRYSLDGDTLKAVVLWSGIEGERLNQHAGIVYHDGKLYHSRGAILDAATGKILEGTTKKRHNRIPYAVPDTRHQLWVAGGHVYGVEERKGHRRRKTTTRGVCSVFTVGGKKVSENVLPLPEYTEAEKKRMVAKNGRPGWGFSYSCPFSVVGDVLLIRSNDRLWCIGETGE
jgi:hypothetical protein